MFHASEIITLLFGLPGIIIIFRFFRPDDFPGAPHLRCGALAIVCAYIFTVAEGVAFGAFFNFLEHTGYAVAGLCFAAGCRRLTLPQHPTRNADTKT